MAESSLLLVAALEESDSDVEDVLVSTVLTERLVRKTNNRKSLVDFSEEEVLRMARFSKQHIKELTQALQLPEQVRTVPLKVVQLTLLYCIF